MELVRSAGHPTELWALLKFKYGGGREVIMPKIDKAALTPGMTRCYEMLNLTSRSFAAVIQSLDEDLRPAICIFYLVLRALDTVEDDMHIPVGQKTAMLKEFHTHLHDPNWTFMDSTEDDKVVLEEFYVISREFQGLDQKFREVIEDICRQMGEGMTVFLEKDVGSMDQWDLYCHYVAGLVGIGLSRLFAASGLEDEVVARDQRLANSMGLFLQKTNIIRDYLEDVIQGRRFWPQEAWSQFGGSLDELQQLSSRGGAVQCLNLLVTNALQHVPDVLTYMSRIRNQSVFNFCAIPQTMAIATLCACYNNPAVFCGVVKIRKGQAVELIMSSTSMNNLRNIMAHYTRQIVGEIPSSDPSSEKTHVITGQVLQLCSTPSSHTSLQQSSMHTYLAGMVTVAAIAYVLWNSTR